MDPECPWSSSGLLSKRDKNIDLLLKYLSNPFKKQLDKGSFAAAIITSLLVSLAIFAIFCFIRPLNTIVYAPRLKHSDEKHAPPPIEKGYFTWLLPVFKAKEDDLVEKIGLDAIVFLRFIRMMRNMLAVLSILAVIMIAVNSGCTAHLRDKVPGSVPDGVDPFVYMSPQFVFGRCIGAHILQTWIFNIVICYFIWSSYRKLVKLKTDWFKTEEYRSALYAKTVMVTDVPGPLQSNNGLADIIAAIQLDPRIADDMKARIARDVKELPKLVHEHEKTVRELESVLAKYLRYPDRLPPNRPVMTPFKDDRKTRGRGKVDAIEYLDQRLKLLETRIKEVRSSIDLKAPLPYGFVSFSTVENAHTVAFQASKQKKVEGTKIKLAPRPTDLIWKNLAKSKRQRRWNRTWGWVLYIFLTVAWIVPNAFIATFLANFSTIGAFWPEFQATVDRHRTFWSIVQGVAAPGLTSLIFLCLPYLMRGISARQGDISKTARERHATAKLFSFFVFNNLVIFTIFGTLWGFVAVIVNETGIKKTPLKEALKKFSFADSTITAVFNVSRFWVVYLLQRNMGAFLDLIQLYALSLRWFYRKFRNPTPREMIEWSAPQPMDFASYYNYFLFYATIVFSFAPVHPLVVPVACLYFAIDSFFRKYAFMYIFVTKYESGGMFWRILVNRTLVAASFGNLVTAGLVWVKFSPRASPTTAAALVPILGLILFKLYCVKVFDDKMNFSTEIESMEGVGEISEEALKRHRNDHLSDRYGHPALTKKLMKPLVHDKVKHLLARVYTERRDEAEPLSAGVYVAGRENVEGVGMETMQDGVPGVPATGMEHYGFLKEHQLDYNSLSGHQKREFGYLFDSRPMSMIYESSSRPGTPGGPRTPGRDFGTPPPPGTPGPFYITPTRREPQSNLGSPSLGPKRLNFSTGRSPLATGDAPVELPADSPVGRPGGYFDQRPQTAGTESESDLAALLRASQAMGRSMTPAEGYESQATSRPTSRAASNHSQDQGNGSPQQRPPLPPGTGGWNTKGQGPSGYESYRKG
ncbi:hypothetical protein H072_4603 [Dactylellina haptotyla CBS 200.50]|uniref:DUF221-domain-containing protein n=1 Tax=Dactylellina haptotyla (strain CBS 200.50) TaxID=1284197 RepID=S8AF09_DACHA|nr:hypothetical protein H072_4603 [Dactylellina haptotyla CBS 200.50]